jgi:hypothetical protein
MATLPALPTELHRMILRECDFKAYLSLSLVTKAIHSIAIPYLYREIHWGCYPGHLTKWSSKNLQHLVRSLIENPRLAAHVRSLNLYIDYEYDFDYEEEYLESYPISQADFNIHAQSMVLLRSLEFDDDSTGWSDALEAGNPDAWIALLLSQLGALRSLALNAPLLHHSTYITTAFNQLARIGHFKHLRRVVFGEILPGYEMAGLRIPNELVIPLFSLPSLDELELTLTDPMVKTWELDSKKASKSLTKLRLYRSHITGDDVDGLLSLTPALREVYCGFLRDEREADITDKIDYSLLHGALSRVSGTLEILAIDVRWNNKSCDAFGVDLGTLGQLPMPPLTEFRALKRLEIPGDLLLGKKPWTSRSLVDTLPPNLQSLTLKDESATWRMPWGTMSEQTRSRDNAMQGIIDRIGQYLEHPARSTMLESLTVDLANGPRFSGDLVDPLTDRYYSVQVEQLRKLAETACVALSVVFARDTGSYTSSAMLVVYDPVDPGMPAVEQGVVCTK